MTSSEDNRNDLVRENALLRSRVEELEARLRSDSAFDIDAFRSWADSASLSIFLLRLDRFIYVNTAFADLVDVPHSQLLDRPCWELVYSEDSELVRRRLADRHAGLESEPIFRLRVGDTAGRVRWIESHETIVTFQGAPVVLGFVRDVTDWVESKRLLDAEKERYRTVVESAGEAIFTIDRHGIFLFMNWETARQLGGKPQDFVGRSQWDIFPKALADRQMQAIREVLETGEGFSREVPTVMPDGPHFHHTTGVPIRDLDGHIVAVLCIARDVTDLTEARNALRAAETRYSQLLENLPVGVLQLSPDRRLVAGNAALSHMHGYDTVDEWLGALADDIVADKARADEINGELFAKGSVRNFEVEVKRKDGSTFWVSLNASVRYDQDGKPESVDGVEIDITKRKTAEEALHLSETKYRHLFETAQVGMFRTTLDGSRILGANRHMAETFGYTLDEVFQRTVLDMWFDVSEREAFVETLRQKGEIRDFEFTVRTKSGEPRTGLVAARFDQGEIEGSVIDITERKRAEQALAESEQLFRALAESSPAAIIIFQDEGIVYANPLLLEVLGLKTSDFETMKFWDLMAPEFRDKVRQLGMARQRGEVVPDSYEVRVVTPNGQSRWVLFSGRRIAYKGRPAGLGLAVDITERKLMEDRLRESEERFRRIAERSFDAILVCDMDGTFKYASPSVVQIGGYTPDQVVGRHLSEFIVVSYMGAIGRGLALLAAGKPVESLQFEAIGSDGTSRFLEANAVPILKDGRVVAFQAVVRDTTERRRAEELLQRSYDDQSRQLRQVAGGLAHDVYNDLFPVTVSLYRLRQRLEKSTDLEKERSLRLLSLAEGAIGRAISLTESVNLYSKMQKGKVGACADLAAVVRSVLDHNSERIMRAGVRINSSVPDGLLIGCAENQLHPMFNNLLLNALDALEGGKAPTIDITARAEEGRAVIEFSDNGCGIPADVLPRIFEPFFSTKPHTGTGLGLAIVKRIVDISGGRITVQSALDNGTTFSILLPTDVGTSSGATH